MAGTLTVDTIQSDSSYVSTLNVASKMNFAAGMQIGGQDTTFGGMRNRIINGAMMVSQRGTSFSGLTDGYNATYALDRWAWQETGTSTGVQTISQDTTSPPVGFINSLKVLTTTAHAVGSGNAYGIFQHIEGLNIADLDWGKATAKPITVSFWVKSSLIGTFSGSIKNGANFDRSYVFNYTINSANTWEYKTVTIPGDTTGTWPTDNTRGIMLNFDLGTGSTYQGTANTWTAVNNASTSGSQSVVGTLNATWNITGVQLEKGSAASAFENRQYGQELALCQRYCVAYNTVSGQPVAIFGATSASTGAAYVYLPVTPRVNPTGIVDKTNNWVMNNYGPGSINTNALSFHSSTSATIGVSMSGGASMTAGYSGQLYSSGGAGQFYTTGSEL